MNEILKAAHIYHNRGFSVIPIQAGEKKPLISWEEYQNRRATEEEIRAWWSRWPEANVGIVTGAVSGLIVIDLDTLEAKDKLKELLTDCDLNTVPRSRTGKGWQLFFRHPGVPILNRAAVLPGLDVRGDGGYVVAPPSIHPSGKVYKWEIPINGELPKLPVEVLKLISSQGNGAAKEPAPVIEGKIPEGQRNAALTSLAGSMRRRGMSEASIVAALQEENKTRCDPPLPEREVEAIAKSVSRYEPKQTENKTTNCHFTLIGAKDLLALDEPELPWLWEGILPAGGLSLLVAKPKVGKTTLALNLAVAVSRGAEFLGKRTQQAPVVYLALEEKKTEIQRKLKVLEVSCEPISFHFGSAPHEATREVSALVKQTGAKLLVVDVLQKFCRVRDLNDYAQVSNALEPLMAIARGTGCHILLTHHAGKADRADGDDILGSTGLLGGVDTSIHIKKRDKRRSFFTIQRYGEDTPETVIELQSDGSLEAVGSRQEVELEETLPLILEALEEGPLTEREVYGKVERDKSKVAKGLRLLFEREKICRTGSGKKGDPYTYEKKAAFLPSITIEGNKGEFKTAKKPLELLPKFSLGDVDVNSLRDGSSKGAFSDPKEGSEEGWEEV